MEQFRYSLVMALASLIWGTAFVAQRMGADVLDAYSFNSVRSFIGAFALLPAILTLGRKSAKEQISAPSGIKDMFLGGALCGLILTVSTLFQQVGLEGTSAGKAGFITALYILIVPLLGLFVGRKVGALVWIAVAMALVGMFQLCIKAGFTIEHGDLCVLCCAFTFSFHILLVDHFAQKVDGMVLSMLQFFFCGFFSLVPFLWKAAPIPEFSAVLQCWAPILYTAIFSSAIAYTLQIVSQKHLNPTVASLVMSLESVFAALSGWIILHEKLTPKELFGCVLVFLATIVSQIPTRKGSK